MHTRDKIISPLIAFLQSIPQINAVWEGGSAAWGRIDNWSDIDLQVDVADDLVDDIMWRTENFLEQTFGIDLKFPIQPSVWPGVTQTFFRLKDTSPFLLLDFAVIKTSAKSKFLEQEIHGNAIVHFDRAGITQGIHANTTELFKKLEERLPMLKTRFEIFQILVEKELKRGNAIEAFNFYLGFTVQPIIEALRIVHCPYHWNFHSRYIHYELPKKWVEKIQPLYFVADADELKQKWKQAAELFADAIQEAENSFKKTAYV
ncbi:MAG: hypothetical protein U0V74_10445 [Chitinophagales bacterium]